MSRLSRFLEACRSASNLRRALTTSVIVGPVLTAINQGDVVMRAAGGDEFPRIALIRMVLTFLVPFVVSLTSAALAQTQRRQMDVRDAADAASLSHAR